MQADQCGGPLIEFYSGAMPSSARFCLISEGHHYQECMSVELSVLESEKAKNGSFLMDMISFLVFS